MNEVRMHDALSDFGPIQTKYKNLVCYIENGDRGIEWKNNGTIILCYKKNGKKSFREMSVTRAISWLKGEKL
jgi:hypothetical protein